MTPDGSGWHADTAELERYAAGSIDHVRASSVEAHLVACALCRRRTATYVDTERLARTWADVVDVLDAPRPGLVERVLRVLRVPESTARLVAATPSLRLSWLVGVMLALAFSVVAAGSGGQATVVFLVVAPLVPLAGVAAAFGSDLDPSHEVTCAAPTSGARLLLLRAAAVFVSTLVVASLAALALPDTAWTAAAWILPALGLTLTSLSLSTAMTAERAAVAVALAWVAIVVTSGKGSGDWLAAFHAGGQLAFLVVAAVAALVVVYRREAFEIRSQL